MRINVHPELSDLDWLVQLYSKRDTDSWHKYIEFQARILLSENNYFKFCKQTGETPQEHRPEPLN